MIGFLKSITLATVLVSASFAYAGDLKAVPPGGSNMHPAPMPPAERLAQDGNTHNDVAIPSVSKEQEDKMKLRKLRPAK